MDGPDLDTFLGTTSKVGDADHVASLESQYNIPQGLYSAILNRGEASGVNAVSPKGAMGRAQLMPATARSLGVDPTDPAQNLDGGARYVAQLVSKYGADRPDLVAAAYNAGPGAVDRHGGVPPYAETQKYVARVTGALPSSPLDAFLGGSAITPHAAGSSAFLSSIGQGAGAAPAPAALVTPADSAVAPQSTKPPSQAFLDNLKGDGSVINDVTGESYNAAQTAWVRAHSSQIPVDATGRPTAEVGSASRPFMMTTAGNKPETPGAHYVDLGGNLQQVPLTPSQVKARTDAEATEQMGSVGGSLLTGTMQGFAPEAIGGARALVTGAKNVFGMGDGSSMGDAYAQGRDVAREQLGTYSSAHPLLSGIATGVGSLATAVPAIAAGGELLAGARVPALLGPTGEFLAGAAGRAATGEAAPGVGNVLLRGVSGAANAAVQGGAAGVAGSHLNPNEPLGEQAALGAAGGALLHGSFQAMRGVGNVLMDAPALGPALRSFTEPLTASGREAIADRAIRSFADGGPTLVDATEHVPGSVPTLATATGNRGLMAAEKALRATPDGANVLGARDAANDRARQVSLDAVRGDNDSLQSLIDARATATGPLRDAAFADAAPVDPSPVAKTIDTILASPEGKRDAVQKVLTNIKSKLTDADGMPETDPAQLYGVRGAISDLYSGVDAPDAKLASSQLSTVKDALDKVIETGAPGFRSYLKTFADASGPVNEQKFLMARSLTDRTDSPTLAKIKSTIDAIDAGRRKPGAQDAKSVSDAAYQALQGLRADLARADLTPDRNIRSDTLQNLASNALLQKAGLPATIASFHVPGVGFARQLASGLYDAQNLKITNLLLQKMADPSYGASAFESPLRFVPVGGNALLSAAGGEGVNDNGSRLLSPRKKLAGSSAR